MFNGVEKVEVIRVTGPKRLRGEVRAAGSKNAALPTMAAALLTDDQVVLHNVPEIKDVETMGQVLSCLGAEISSQGDTLVIQPAIRRVDASYELVKQMRASFYVAGPLLGRMRRAEVPLPGGCVIGSRPVDFHIQAFQRMGAKVKLEHGYMKAKASKLHGARIYLDPRFSSVGTTINILLAAVLALGETVIENAARDPEIVNLASFLKKMGARIAGEGTSTIQVEGVKKLSGCEHTVMSDRMEAGTFLIGAAATRGRVTVSHCEPETLTAVIEKLEAAGVSLRRGKDWVRAEAKGELNGVDVITAPYPGFPTDLQPPFVVLLVTSQGVGVVEETIHDSRFRYADELKRMGANIKRVDNSLVIQGPCSLMGAPVEASDLRAGAALILAGLAAEGESEISEVEHIHRGYEQFTHKLAELGVELQAEVCA